MSFKVIEIVTGSRAEFGLLRPIMTAVREHPALRLRVVATGLHLVTQTVTDLHEAGIAPDACVEMQREGESGRLADAAATGRGVAAFAARWATDPPEVVLVLGDRVEAFAAAAAASIGGIVVAHVHGGDRAEGVADEAMRHAISKLAHLHFAATQASRDRLIRMGEPAERVWNVGSPASDGLECIEADPAAPDYLVLQHPIGDDEEVERERMAATLAAVRATGETSLVLMPNRDAGWRGILAAIENSELPSVHHLPRSKFLALLKGAKALIGNSSAGLIEAAAIGTPSLNIGPRQAGRERPASVMDCDYGRDNVAAALMLLPVKPDGAYPHPYGDARTGPRIATLLAGIPMHGIYIRKRNAY